MHDDASHSERPFNEANHVLRLGYITRGQNTCPFTLTLHDLTNLFVVGQRSRDIYYSFLIQLCDEHQIPVFVLKGSDSDAFEEQICERRFWQLDAAIDHITFNLLDLGGEAHPTRQVGILVDLLASLYPLTPTAQNLLHIAIWKTLLTTPTPSLRMLQGILPTYRHHGTAYMELCRFLEALPTDFFHNAYDNVSLAHLRPAPTIITLPMNIRGQLILNLLLLKLLSHRECTLPPLFILESPLLNSRLLHWLCSRYAEAGNVLVFFNSYDTLSVPDDSSVYNLILTTPQDSTSSPLHNELTAAELRYLQVSCDRIAVKLRSSHITSFATIF